MGTTATGEGEEDGVVAIRLLSLRILLTGRR
jgi:hypothetical protein